MISFNFEYFDSVSPVALNWHTLLYETTNVHVICILSLFSLNLTDLGKINIALFKKKEKMEKKMMAINIFKEVVLSDFEENLSYYSFPRYSVNRSVVSGSLQHYGL